MTSGSQAPNPTTETPNPSTDPTVAETVRSEEQLKVATEWSETGRLRVRRRIVSEVRTIEVPVRREELVLDTDDLESGKDGVLIGVASDSVPVPAAPVDRVPLVVVLHEEVPIITMTIRPYEKVTVTTTTSTTEVPVTAATLREEVVVEQVDTPTAPQP